MIENWLDDVDSFDIVVNFKEGGHSFIGIPTEVVKEWLKEYFEKKDL
jgi:hypothetical protein